VARPDDRGSATRERIIAAALETLKEEGFAETTARAIARHGGFNQALIFYHFGSLTALLMEAFRDLSKDQVERYNAAAAEVTSLSDLVDIARRLHREDIETGAVQAVTQLMAAATDKEQGGAILDRFEQWISLVEIALQRAMAKTPLASMVPSREAAYAISAMFLGIELMTRLDPERSEAESVFDMMANMAQLIEQLGPVLLPALDAGVS
jgi:AcrR family transcriptional regulator